MSTLPIYPVGGIVLYYANAYIYVCLHSKRNVGNVHAAFAKALGYAAQTRQRCRSASDGACGGASSRLLVLGFS